MVSFMKTITKELGVKCSFCHIPNDYTSDKKANKIVAREMIKMTQNANNVMANLNFKEVSCWTCHRGNTFPERSLFKMSQYCETFIIYCSIILSFIINKLLFKSQDIISAQ